MPVRGTLLEESLTIGEKEKKRRRKEANAGEMWLVGGEGGFDSPQNIDVDR